MDNYVLNLYDDKISITLPYSTKDTQEIGFSSGVDNIILKIEDFPRFKTTPLINNLIELDTLINFNMRSYTLIKDLDIKNIADLDAMLISDIEISPTVSFSNVYMYGVILKTSDGFVLKDSKDRFITAKEVE